MKKTISTDTYDGTNYDLRSTMDDVLADMLEQHFKSFVVNHTSRFCQIYNSPEMYELMYSLREYIRDLFKLESKTAILGKEARARDLPSPRALPSELLRIDQRAQDVSRKYGWLLLNFRSAGKTLSSSLSSDNLSRQQAETLRWSIAPNQLRNLDEDKNFFETMIFFCGQVLKPGFDRADEPKIEDEMGRLFRTSAFNTELRTQAEEAKQEKFAHIFNRPKMVYSRSSTSTIKLQQLQDYRKAIIDKYAAKYSIPKDIWTKTLVEGSNTQRRPGHMMLSPYKAAQARSPLMSLLLPSPRDKVQNFDFERKRKIAKKQQYKMPLEEAQGIIRNEISKKLPSIRK